jgi:hypothetical protein
MLTPIKILALATALLISACSSMSGETPTRSAPPPSPTMAQLTFQNGQTATLKLDGDPALRAAFLKFAAAGAYTETPVYRQLPGIFILTGKPRLAGQGFVTGQPMPQGKSEARFGQVGLVTHADGTVGPELVLIYGPSVTTCCEAPANLRLGTITEGKWSLRHVQRGDNLTSIAIQP